MGEIDGQLTRDLDTSPNRRNTVLHLGGERRLPRTIRDVVIAHMVKRLR